MPKVRLEHSRICFPSTCARCGRLNPSRATRLTLPYRAWWRSNPVITAPACTTCAVNLGLQEWTSFLLMLGAAFAATFYLLKWGILVLIYAQQRFFRSASDWVYSGWFVEVVACIVLLSAASLLGSLRDRFLRRDHLKLKITDHGTDWVELSSSDNVYFGELVNQSQLHSE